MAPTTAIGFLVSDGTCVVFVFGSSLLVIYPAHLLLLFLSGVRFAAYRTWLDEDARAGAVLTASMEEHLFADIVGFEHAHQM